MKYMGSKARHAKDILPIILKDHPEDSYYVEPFVGGANMIDKVPTSIQRIGVDINEYLIEMWTQVSQGWLPPELITEDDYQWVKNNWNYNKALTGYVAFSMSFGGKWFGGYRRDIKGAKDDPDLKKLNEQQQSTRSYNSIVKQAETLKGVEFKCGSYLDTEIPDNSTIYCDPPYKGATKYKDSFDHEKFYQWCREKSKQGHRVYISEYEMPEDFQCIWIKEVKNSLTNQTDSKKGVEKLFMI